jgi:hypothetical protein
MKGYTVYATNSGVEIRATSKVSAEESATEMEGRIALRFFAFGDGDTQSLKFILTPLEAYSIYLFTAEIAKKGGKQTLTHKFQGEEGEVTTRFTLEKWEKESKSGYAYSLKRGESKAVNVAMDFATFLYVGELLKALSLEQAWSSYKPSSEFDSNDTAEAPETEAGETQTAPFEKEAEGPSGNSNRLTGEIEAVRQDGQGFKMDGRWFKITDRTKVEAEVTKGTSVSLYFSEARGGVLYANAVYPLKKA